MLTREMIEEYLDGALDAAGRSQVEQEVAGDPAAAKRLEGLKAQRALRAAAYASYAPTNYEAAALAHEVLEACERETHIVGRISPLVWTRRIAGVAAAVMIAAIAFGAGRWTAPTQNVMSASSTPDVYAYYYGPRGNVYASPRLKSHEEANDFAVNKLQGDDRNNSQGAAEAVSYTTPGKF